MPCMRHIIVCEGESEWAYLQRLQSFLNQQPQADGAFDPPLQLIAPERVVVKNGTFGKLKKSAQPDSKGKSQRSIHSDLGRLRSLPAQRQALRRPLREKNSGIPDFLFSYHNFEDFFALHWDGECVAEWLRFGGAGHFTTPLHADGYLPEIKRIFPEYGKGDLPADFITWRSLKNLKSNLAHQPSTNPHNLLGIRSFADFLIREIERAYPGKLE